MSKAQIYGLTVTAVGEHLVYTGPRVLESGKTASQHVYEQAHLDVDNKLPVFSTCGIHTCLQPSHLRPSLTAYRLTQEN